MHAKLELCNSEDHPDLAVSKQFRLASTSKVVPPKLPTPFKLFCDAKMDKFLGEGLTPTEARYSNL